VRIQGQVIPAGRPNAARDAGIAMVYQELSICDDLSVQDNVLLGQEAAPERTGGLSRMGRWSRLDRRRGEVRVREVLARLGHADLEPARMASDCSIAEKQVVEIARALAGRAKVLILDEPTSSLPLADVQRLFDTIAALREEGMAVIYISHFLEEVQRVCDSYFVLRDGSVSGEGTLADVREEDVVALMVGRSVGSLYPSVPHEIGEPVLRLDGISTVSGPNEVDLTLHQGEILGVAGLVGAGRTETMRCVYGLDRMESGSLMRFEGEPTGGGDDAHETMSTPATHWGTPADAIRAGIGMVSEDRKTEGLAQQLSIADNISASGLARYGRFGWLGRFSPINGGTLSDASQTWMQRLQVKAPHERVSIATLSGGNQQKVALARVMHQDASILILDEPTRGVDVGTKAEIYQLIGEFAASGRSVIFVSSYFEELIHVCDTIAVMARGQVIDQGPAEAWTTQKMLMAAMGKSVLNHSASEAKH
ncbi:MAG: sugar ABC transporter ATP-binding protein, partial [Planctomycetota bacterium]